MLTPFLAGLLLLQAGQPSSQGPAYTQSTTTKEGIVEMRTAAQRFTAEGKPDVWLVGVIHIGQKKYYGEIQSLLDSQEVVLYERVKPPKNAPKAPEPKPDQKPATPIYKVLSDALGLEFQLSEIKYDRPNWVNSDLSMDDLDRLNKEKGNGKPTGFDSVKQILDPNSPMAATFSSMLQTATPGMKEAIKLIIVKKAASGDAPGLDPVTQEIILHERNKEVLKDLGKTIDKTPAPKSIAIFYGALHMPDMETALKSKFGYKLGEKKWFLAATADPAKMDAQGKMIYDALEKATAPKKSGGGKLLAALPNL